MENLIFLVFVFSSIGIFTSYFLNREHVRNCLTGSPVFLAITGNPNVFYGIVATIFSTLPSLFEVFMDYVFNWMSDIDDRKERIFMVLLNGIPGIIILSMTNSIDLVYLFWCFHILQYIGCLCIVLSLCNKLVPKHFTGRKVIIISFVFALSATVSTIDCGSELLTWTNLIVSITVIFSLSYLVLTVFLWIKSIGGLVTIYDFEHQQTKLSVKEVICILYISSLSIIVVLSGLAASFHIFRWQQFDGPVIYVLIYCLVAFSLFPTTIPARVARYMHMQSKQHEESCRATIRYLSHELRSPLDVIRFETTSVLKGLHNNQIEERKSMDKIKHSEVYILSIMNDLVIKFNVDSNALTFCLKSYSLQKIVDIFLAQIPILDLSGKCLVPPQEINTSDLFILFDFCTMEIIIRNLVFIAARYSKTTEIISVFIEKGKLPSRRRSSFTATEHSGRRDRVFIDDLKVIGGVIISISFMGDAPAQNLPGIFDFENLTGGLRSILSWDDLTTLTKLNHGRIAIVDGGDSGRHSISLELQQCLPPAVMSAARSETRRGAVSNRIVIRELNEFRILLVDDSVLNRSILHRKLMLLVDDGTLPHCTSFLFVDDGIPAVEDVKTSMNEGRPIALVFMDNVMSHMHGPEAAQRMRALGFKNPIIGVTGNVFPSDIRDFIDHGADEVLGKPVDLISLRALLEKISFGGETNSYSIPKAAADVVDFEPIVDASEQV